MHPTNPNPANIKAQAAGSGSADPIFGLFQQHRRKPDLPRVRSGGGILAGAALGRPDSRRQSQAGPLLPTGENHIRTCIRFERPGEGASPTAPPSERPDALASPGAQ
jgi:hypothetical protein